jgi:hypothetical protein
VILRGGRPFIADGPVLFRVRGDPITKTLSFFLVRLFWPRRPGSDFVVFMEVIFGQSALQYNAFFCRRLRGERFNARRARGSSRRLFPH